VNHVLKDRYLAKLARLGQLSFEARLKGLFDPGTCELINVLDWDAAWKQAVTTARGLVHGRPCLAYATNFLVDGGTVGATEASTIVALLGLAARERLPVVALLHSNGARVTERYDAMAGNGMLFKEMTRLSGVVPQLAACMGLCLGVAAYLAALADLNWMVAEHSHAATTSPAVIRLATGQQVKWDELGGARMHASQSGFAHFVAQHEAACLADIRRVLGLLGCDRPFEAPATVAIEALVPRAPSIPYDVRTLIDAIVDHASFQEVHKDWGQSLVCGLAQLGGRPIGVLANQSSVRSGVLDTQSLRKASRFAQLCNAWGFALVYLVDVPGLMVSMEEEQAGILDAGAIFFHAVDTDVPRIAVVIRKCYGGAFVMMQARQAGGDRVYAYPNAQIGIAGPEVTFAIVHGKEHLTHSEPKDFRNASIQALRQVPTDAEAALAAGLVDRIIEPSETRAVLIDTLAEIGPSPTRIRHPRKHPNLPV
jgi:acetyl-CoA carboxylase carboxyltransferase component